MLKIIKKNKGQNTAEYAILIALVIGAIIAMQTYAQRGLQARMRGTSIYMKDQMGNALETARASNPTAFTGGVMNKTAQYEPYYQNSTYAVDKDSRDVTMATPTQVGKELNSVRRRAKADVVNAEGFGAATTGYDETTYNGTIGAQGQDN